MTIVKLNMKAISIRQPYASWIAEGKKTIETRSWKTNYRGDMLIVSSKTLTGGKNLPKGQALGIANLADCRPMVKEDEGAAMVKSSPGLGKYAWVLSDIRKIKPFPVQGKAGIYDVDFDYEFI